MPETAEKNRMRELKTQVAALEKDHSALNIRIDEISAEIRDLQDKILEIGGIKLRTQKSKVDGIKTMIQLATDAVTKAEVGLTKAERDLINSSKSMSDIQEKLQDIESELLELENSISIKAEALAEVKNSVEAVQTVMEEKLEERANVKGLLEERTAHLNHFRSIEVSKS